MVATENVVHSCSEAIKMANKKDIIILAGKGHEPYQEINGVKHPFDERIIVNDIIEKLDSDTYDFSITDANILGDVYEKRTIRTWS